MFFELDKFHDGLQGPSACLDLGMGLVQLAGECNAHSHT